MKRKITLGDPDSTTGGIITERMTSVPGSSAYYLSGLTSYSNQSKVELAGIPPLLLEMNGAVSREVAIGLAEGIQEKVGSTIGLGVTGVAGPSGGSVEKPVGLVHLALSMGTEVEHQEHLFKGNRERIRLGCQKNLQMQ